MTSSIHFFTLVQGPPGTGKTTVACRILKAWSREHAKAGVLATSDSNIAVDNLLEGMVKQGVKVVRVGRPENSRPELLQYSAEEMAATELGVDRRDLYSRKDGSMGHRVLVSTEDDALRLLQPAKES